MLLNSFILTLENKHSKARLHKQRDVQFDQIIIYNQVMTFTSATRRLQLETNDLLVNLKLNDLIFLEEHKLS